VVLTGLAILLVACGGGPSLGEYAAEIEGMVGAMNSRLDAADARLSAGTRDLPALLAYVDERLAARNDFLAVFTEVTPAEEVEVLHEAARGVITRLVAAETAFASAAHQVTDVAEFDALEGGPLGAAARAADEEAIAICRAANDRLAATESRRLFADVLWVPEELREVVDVALGCTAAERAQAR
jgi:hypothetical protein